MAQYIDKDKVIEYIKKRLIPTVTRGNIADWERGADNERINFLSYINTLPEEPASEDLEEEINRVDDWYPVESKYIQEIAHHFAEWQKKQMMKDAIECVVEDWCGDSPEITIPLNPQYFKIGDKVKIIIVKDEQQ